ncbi:MAG TPA: ASCH domain-containing protein [Actinomycetota bacterium]|nr:ASCH domain-containing protein [Actinomycetota bacterium]
MEASALVLDVTHRARRFSCAVPPDSRPLAALQEAAQLELGTALGLPLGMSDAAGAAPEFLFLLPRDIEGWEPLREWASVDDPGFRLYVGSMLGGWEPPTRAMDVFYFGDGPEMAAKLAHLIVKGVKRGTTGWVDAEEREGSTIPSVGMVSIVTDGFGYPQCALQTERVEYLRFADIGAEHAWAEGEGDRTLENWREGHLAYFHRQAAQLNLTFTEDVQVFFEHFRVLAVFGRADR